ncbi:MAG: hypothetical protein JSV33_06870 [bacterium]|nr:MAG: hypothetical protein JSV33_06870 [bacterium]
MKRLVISLVIAFSFSSPVAGGSVSPLTGGAIDGCVLDSGQAVMPAMNLASHEKSYGIGVAACILEEWSVRNESSPEWSRPHSPVKMGAASLLLPGLGQQMMGRTLRSKIYFGLEGLSWIAVGSFLWQGHVREDAYKEYAVIFAGVRGTDHTDDYYRIIGEYISNDGPGGYNEDVRREARDIAASEIDDDDWDWEAYQRTLEGYYDANKIVGDLSWRWETEGARQHYSILREGSRTSYRRALYAGIFALALRVVSTIDAVKLAMGGSPVNEGKGKVSIDIGHKHGGFSVSLKKAF